MSLVPISTPLPGPSVTRNRTVRCGQLCAIVGSAEARKATTATRVARSVGSERFAADMRLLPLSTYKVTRASPIASCNHTEAKWAAQSTVLVTRRERPRRRSAAEQGDELATLHVEHFLPYALSARRPIRAVGFPAPSACHREAC